MQVKGLLQATGDGEYLWRGHIHAVVRGECRRCLTDVLDELSGWALFLGNVFAATAMLWYFFVHHRTLATRLIGSWRVAVLVIFVQSTTSSTGAAMSLASSAVLQLPSVSTPSWSPLLPSMIATSPVEWATKEATSRSLDIRKGSRL